VKAVYRPAAAADIDQAYAWYEKELKGLGEEFLAEAKVTAESVLEMPEAYPIVLRQTRRALVRRFSYGLFYPR
jgi:plasmid stabilization system protein ParE